MHAEHPDTEAVRDLIAHLTAWLDIDVHDPTSQVTGGGAIRFAEQTFGALHGGRRTLLLPSATFAMRSALLAAGVKRGQRVLIPAVDWTSTLSAVREIGATPVTVNVDAATMTIDAQSVRDHLDQGVGAIVACHLHGVPADIPALRGVVGDSVPIIEDCAQALGSSIDGQLVGTHGDFGIFSFANKAINAGEAAMVTSSNVELHDRLLELTAHPVRQTLEGIASPNLATFSVRVAPACAMQLAVALGSWDRNRAVAELDEFRSLLGPTVESAVLGRDPRRQNAASSLPIRTGAGDGFDVVASSTPSTALRISSVIAGHPLNADVTLVHRAHKTATAGTTGARRAG